MMEGLRLDNRRDNSPTTPENAVNTHLVRRCGCDTEYKMHFKSPVFW